MTRRARQTYGYRLLRQDVDASVHPTLGSLDAWGNGMGALFDVCDELERRGPVSAAGHQFLRDMGYRPGAAGPPPREDSTFRDLDQVSERSLVEFGHTLDRWTDRIRARGEDY